MDFTNKVAIVTGAGAGLGRSHAMFLSERGAKVVVNDLGGTRDGSGASQNAADAVVSEIRSKGGIATSNYADITDYNQAEAMVTDTLKQYGRVDILINNAGILRDKTFQKGSLEDFQKVLDVHVMGSVNCCKAAWDTMKEQGYGRLLVTTSSSGLYGNFGQSNYGAAKMAVVGLMKTLMLEGAKYNIKINALAPTAATRMTEGLIPEDSLKKLTPEAVSAGALYMVSEDAPTGSILAAGGGCFAVSRIIETEGVFLGSNPQPEDVEKNWDKITNPENQQELEQGAAQSLKFLKMIK